MTIFSEHTKEKAEKARLTIENFYQNFLFQQNEREERLESKEREISESRNDYFLLFWLRIGELESPFVILVPHRRK